MKKMNLKKGSTLIELLVVVAIIGILASVVLSSLSNARAKGGDAAVKSNLNIVRAHSEIFASNNSYSYLPAGGAAFGIASPCPAYSGVGTNMLSRDPNISAAVAEAINRGSGVSSCYNSATRWAVAVGLRTNANNSWCIDSAGNSKIVASVPGSAINASTFVCN